MLDPLLLGSTKSLNPTMKVADMSQEHGWSDKINRIWESPAVTLIGANETGGTTSVILNSLTRQDCEFSGVINLVNPRGETIFGRTSYTSIDDIDGELGIVWLLVGAHRVLGLLDELAQRNPRAVIIFAGGFAEAGDHDAQAALRRWSEETGVPLFGPQSLGFVSFTKKLNSLDLNIAGELRAGDIGFISQSGGLLGLLLRETLGAGFGVHSAFSVGNEAATGYQDLAEALLADGDLRALAIYVENLGSVSRFAHIAQLAARKGKPLIMLLAGLSEAGQKMAASHTGALATPSRLVRGIAEQFGVILVKNADELLAAMDALRSSQYRRWGSGRIGFYTGSGGSAVILSDALSEFDLKTPALKDETVKSLLGEEAVGQKANPYDMGAGLLGWPEEFTRRVGTFINDGNFDIAVHLFDIPDPNFAPHVFWGDEAIRLTREARQHPVLATGVNRIDKSNASHFDEHVTISYGISETLTKLRAISTWSCGDDGDELCDPQLQDVGLSETRVVLGDEMRAILADVSVHWPYEICVERNVDIRAALEGATFPMVAKAEAGLAHRAKAGGVLTQIRDLDSAVAGVEYLRALFQCDVTLSTYIPHDEEHFIGLSRGPQGQPLLAMGPGGGGVEENDIGLRLLPMSSRQLALALERYLPAVRENQAFIRLLDGLNKLMDDERIDSVDLNPLVIDATGDVWALDAKVHLYSR